MPDDTRLPAIVQHRQLSLDDIWKLAQSVAKSGLFGMKTPDQAMALMCIAQAEGRHPALAARDYHIIQNTPAKKAEAMQRDFIEAGGRVQWHELDDTVAEATFSHPAGGTVRIRWDQARVAQAGLGSNPMHKRYPRQMLRSRVVSEGVRTVYPMATSGMYVPEEVVDFGRGQSAEPIDITPKADLDQFAGVDDDLRLAAEEAARDGTEAFRDFWRQTEKEQRAALKDGLAEYQHVAQDADARRAMAADADPFGLPPLAPAAEPQGSPPEAITTAAAGEPPAPERATSEPQAAAATDLLGQPPSEDVAVPLPRDPTIADCEYWARQLLVMLDEQPRTKQRTASIKIANDWALQQMKKIVPDRYDEVRRALAGNA